MSDLDQRLSGITTQWTLLRAAHKAEEGAYEAQRELMGRYLGAVFRYLLAAVRDYQTAEDLTQEFALRFLTGRYRHANPERGRFRDYLKRSLFQLVQDHRRRQGKQAETPLAEPEAISETQATTADDLAFLESWRSELLARTWTALEEHEKKTGQPYHTLLQLRVAETQSGTSRLAEHLAQTLGRPMTPANTRQLLKRARARFGELLFKETSHSLGNPVLDQVEDELADLNLLKYCRHALQRRRGG